MTHRFVIIAAVASTALAVGCGDHGDYRSCDDGCGADEVCWYAHNICVPEPAEDNTCPEGYIFEECATGSCPVCNDCVPACIPEEFLGVLGGAGALPPVAPEPSGTRGP